MATNRSRRNFQLPNSLKNIRRTSNNNSPIAELFVKAEVDTLEKIITKLEPINDSAKIKEVLDYCQSLYDAEEKRNEQTESKATILAGFSGTATAGLLVFLNFFLDTLSEAPLAVRFLGVGITVVSLSLLIISIFCSIAALKAQGYHYPKPMRIFNLAQQTLEDVLKRRAAEYFYSYVRNQAIDDRKLDAYKNATRTFQWSVFLVIPLVLVIFWYSISQYPSSTVVTPTPFITAAPATSMMLTATPTATETSTPTSQAATPTQP